MSERKQPMTPEESRAFLRALPGYPFLPCPICKETEGCDHIGWERARAYHPGLIVPDHRGGQSDA
jgi:hypothetical protein